MLPTIALATFVVGLVCAALSDLLRYEIPDELSLAIGAAFLLIATGTPFTQWLPHILVGGVTLLIGAILFDRGICGGGDVKLFAAAALWMGWQHLPEFVLLTALAGGALAAGLLAARALGRSVVESGRWYSRLLRPGEGVPYGIAISAAALYLAPQLGFWGE
jgi:prepilin peptidase CpaA